MPVFVFETSNIIEWAIFSVLLNKPNNFTVFTRENWAEKCLVFIMFRRVLEKNKSGSEYCTFCTIKSSVFYIWIRMDPHWFWLAGSRRAKITRENRKKGINFMFWSAFFSLFVCSLLSAVIFSFSLMNVLRGGLVIIKLLFFHIRILDIFQL